MGIPLVSKRAIRRVAAWIVVAIVGSFLVEIVFTGPDHPDEMPIWPVFVAFLAWCTLLLAWVLAACYGRRGPYAFLVGLVFTLVGLLGVFSVDEISYGFWSGMMDVHLPIAILAFLAVVGSVLLLTCNLRSKKELAVGHCPVCEYDLTGLSGYYCPECGWGASTR